MAEISEKLDIESLTKTKRVVLFMKGTPDEPMCGFSSMVAQILNYLNLDYAAYNVLEDDRLRSGIKVYSSWPTIPQVYIDGELVGGCDIMREMFESGELNTLLTDKKIIAA